MNNETILKKWYSLAMVVVLVISALFVSSVSTSAGSPSVPIHTENLVIGGQFNPGTQGTEMDIIIDGGAALPGWCVNESVYIYVNTQYPADIYDYLGYFGHSYPANISLLPSAIITNTSTHAPINWPAIAYILNHKVQGAISMEIQKAIWYFSGDSTSFFSSNTQTMIDEANDYLIAHNGVYVPGAGQLEPVICYVPGETPRQVIFYEKNVPPMADLVITSVSAIADPVDPRWYSVSFTIKNQGTLDAAASVASVEIDGSELANPSCPALAAGASVVVTIPSGELADTVDTDTIKAIADINETVVESNESNNASTIVTYSIYHIIASAGPNGTISPSGNIIVGQGTDSTFSIVPAAGYHIADVLVDSLSVGALTSYNFNNLNGEHTIAASFAANQYTLSFDRNGGTGVAPITADYGATLTPPAVPTKEGYTFVGWSPAFPATMPLDGAHLTAQWEITSYTVEFVLGAHGTLGSGNLLQTVNQGADAIAPLVNPVVGWTFTGWDQPFTNVTADLTVNALHSQIMVSITTSAGAHGTINPLGTIAVGYGDDQTFTITPDIFYAVADVEVDGVSMGALTSYTFDNVTTAHSLSVTFTPGIYSITASAGSNGSISFSGTIVLGQGGNMNFTITPLTGYRIADVIVDGISVGPVSNYTFNNVSADHTISTSFAPLWDVNIDHKGNIQDVVRVGIHWQDTGSAGWIPEDVNQDGKVNIQDVVIIGLHWQNNW